MNELEESCLKVFNEYVQQTKNIVSETPALTSFFESDLVLFCIENNYNFAIKRNLDISKSMENILQKKYLENYSITKKGDLFELRKSTGPHSEYNIYFFQKS